MEVILIRHTAVDVPTGTCYGQSDVPLKEPFEELAAATKAELKACGPIDHAYTSPLSRCTRLAAFCGYADAERDPRLMELHFGAWEMKRYDDITDPHLQRWFDDHIHTPATDGESFIQQYERVSRFLDDLRQQPWRRVAVFTHGGVIAATQIYAGLCTAETAFADPTPYGGFMRINLDD